MGKLLSSPGRGSVGSDTTSNLMNLMGRLPMFGNMISGIGYAAKQGRAEKRAMRSLDPREYARMGRKQSGLARKKRMRGIVTPPSIGGGLYYGDD